MRLLIPTSLQRHRNGFPVETYYPCWNKTEMHTVDQINNYDMTYSNAFQLCFARIFVSMPSLALITWACTCLYVVLRVNVRGLCELCVWRGMTGPYYVHNQLLGPNSSKLTHGVTLRSCISEIPGWNPGRDTDCRDWGFTWISSPRISERASN